MTASEEQYIEQALGILQACGLEKDAEAFQEDAGPDPGNCLVQGINLLAKDHLDISRKLDRLQRELEVFTEVNADANEMIEQKIEEISLLRLITDASSRAFLTQDPLKLILGKVIGILGAENGSIMLGDDAEHLDTRATSGSTDTEIDETLPGLALKVAARAIEEKEAVFIDDVGADEDLSSEEANGIGSFASFPLMIENKTIGALNLSSPHCNAFGAETQRIMLIIAGQIAVAVENVRLYGEVRETKEYLEDLVEKAGDGIFTLDRGHKILSWNVGAETVFDRKRPSVLGESFYTMLPESMRPTLREKIQSILDSENIVTIESDVNQKENGPTRVTITLSPIHGADGDVIGVSGIAKDITKRRRLEEDLRELNEAKSNFVSTVSHELRTPLTSIKSLTELLSHEMDMLSEENIERYLNIINEECDRLTGLISGLLDLQKLSAGRIEVDFKPVRMAELVRQVTGLFDGVALQNKTELTADYAAPDDMTEVMGDRGQLLRVMSNLLSNAVKYTDPGDRIYVRLSREGDNVKLSVVDNGRGIPEDQVERVFERFYRVDCPGGRDKGGTGLGLAIAKELVALHGGRIWVESGQSRGCIFSVLIPAAKRPCG